MLGHEVCHKHSLSLTGGSYQRTSFVSEAIAMTSLDELKVEVKRAQSKWTGCDWTTKFGPRMLNLRGLRSSQVRLLARATRGEESCAWHQAGEWLETVEGDAKRAAELGDLAILAAEHQEIDRPGQLLSEAVALESSYRDTVAYSRVLELWEQLAPQQRP